MRLRLFCPLLLFGACLSAQTTIQVPATADPWEAGGYMLPIYPYSPGSGPGEGTVPPEIDFAAGPGKVITIFASGTWSCGNDSSAGPGGGVCDPYPTVDVAPIGGMSGIATAEMTLAGVFLDAVNPPNVIRKDGLGTLFAVGTGGVIPIPSSATRLILGMPDECSPDGPPIQPSCYGDNSGQVSVTYKIWNHADFSVSQSSGAPGSSIILGGYGFGPYERVDIYSREIKGLPSYTVNADSAGAFSVPTHEAQGSYGPELLFAVGVATDSLGAANFSVTPTLDTKPRFGSPGGTVLARALGFGAGETVEIYWNSPRIPLATVTADALGSAESKITVPSNAVRGLNGLLGIGQTTGAIGLGAIRVE